MSAAMFASITRREGGAWLRFRTVTCGCGFEGRIRDATRNGMPPELTARKFAQIGWTNPKPEGGTCPNCSAMKSDDEKKRALSPAQKRAAWCRLHDVKPATKPLPEVIPMQADPPRQPTREDRRRIIDALDEHYLQDRECYSQSWSDKALSQKLNVPQAWVAEERDRVYGPDRNEARSEMTAQLAAVEKQLAGKVEEAMTLAAAFEALQREVSKLKTQNSYAA